MVDDLTQPWQLITVNWYGSEQKTLECLNFTCLWYHAGELPLPLRIVLVKTPEFLKQKVLGPFARIFINLLFDYLVSIEAHAQNLLFLIDKKQKIRGLIYRDMGGVNQLMTKDELCRLPSNLRDPSIYYFNKHIEDAGTALEQQFVVRLLGPLTRQLVKDSMINESDQFFSSWLNEVKKDGQIDNWTLEKTDTDEYQMYLPIEFFCRYGYAELIFMHCIMNYINKKKLMSKTYLSEKKQTFFSQEQSAYLGTIPPCTQNRFFSSLIFDILRYEQHWLK
jgi:hypothetical protein